MKDGKLGCQNMLTTCTVSRDPHYITFDGAVTHFPGICAYEISRTLSSSADFSFRVVATNKIFENPHMSLVYRVEIWLSSKNFHSYVVLEQGKNVLVSLSHLLIIICCFFGNLRVAFVGQSGINTA